MTQQDLIAKAFRAAESANLLLESGDLEGACDRAYYAMFNAARAGLMIAGELGFPGAAKTHGGLIAAFSLHLVKTGKIPVELGRALNRAEELRLIADYRGDPIEREQAEWAVKQASIFIRAIREMISAARIPVITIDGPSASGKGTEIGRAHV